MVDGSGDDSRDTEKENLCLGTGSLVIGVNERAEVRVTFRVFGLGRWPAICFSRDPLEEGQGWIPLGWAGRIKESQLECTKFDYFGGLVHCEPFSDGYIVRTLFFFLPPHLSPSSLLSASLLSSCGE